MVLTPCEKFKSIPKLVTNRFKNFEGSLVGTGKIKVGDHLMGSTIIELSSIKLVQ